MEIKYTAFWSDGERIKRITHGLITDDELQEIIERKEREECGGLEDLKLDSADVDGIGL